MDASTASSPPASPALQPVTRTTATRTAKVSVYCGIDVGTQGVRVALVDLTGTERGAGTAPITGSHRSAGRHEQHPDQWWEATLSALRTALDGAGEPLDVVALALDATSGTVLVEAGDGRARGNALMYDDARAGAQARRAQEAGHELWSALGYRMQASWALPKALWLVENGGLEPGERIVHQSDHLLGRLAGTRVATDTSNALKTGADLRDATWPQDLFTDLGLDPRLLPDLVVPGTPIGSVGAAAAGLTGLRQGTPIVAGMTDGCAAQIAAGALRPGHWSSALGTTLVIKGASTRLLHDPSGAVYSHRHPDGGWMPGGASSSGAGVLSQTFGAGSLQELTLAAAHSVPTSAFTYPLSGAGERFPFVAPEAHAFTIGAVEGPAAQFAALCHGLAYLEKLAYDALCQLGADTSGPVTLTGGASRNRWLNQLRANALGRRCLLPASAEAATGMAVLAASTIDGSVTEAADRMTVIRESVEPDLEAGQELWTGYERFVGELAERGWLDQEVAQRVLATGPATR